jgi:membrane protein
MKKISIPGFNRKAFFEGLGYYAKGLYHKSDEDHIWILTSGIAFNLIICAIPFTLILFSFLGIYLSSEATTATIDNYFKNIVGLTPELKSKIQNLVFTRIQEISHYRTLTAIIGTVGILWTASGLFSTIREVLNRIYKTKMEIFYLWGKLKDIGMVFVSTIFFLLSILSTFILSVIRSIEEKFFSPDFFGLGFIDQLLSVLLGILFSFLMFYIIYKLVPHGKINNKVVIISSVTSTIMWELLKMLFTFYLVNFSNFTAVYGAYAALVAVIFWIYYSSFTFVMGAEIGQLYTERKLL